MVHFFEINRKMSQQDSVDKYINQACEQFNVIVKHPNLLEVVSESLYEELLDEIILGICFDAHRSYKRGHLNLEEMPSQLEQVDNLTLNNQDSIKCVCPKCKKRLVAFKFAWHLNNCMGFGRNSTRIANMKINGKDMDSSSIYSNAASDDENDADWRGEKKRRKRDNRGSNKRKHKASEPDIAVSRSMGATSYGATTSSSLTNSKQICGVITKHSKKKCKNVNCTHHIEQRKSMKCEGDSMNVDIEGNDDVSSEMIRGDSSIDLNSNASSPANSSHGSSRKKDKSSKGRSKSSKKSSRRSLSCN
ncbi:SAGA-associated factor 11 homolog [Chrysoperla carnea]|uniref:SAGA-associated factor 11 homolog n=1 Tax=Chrysoperla carnea TaxID=189513 RepID=UPI001D069268|nr:SAGA-associated factor 11 homolog [Chrysoperla carnea]